MMAESSSWNTPDLEGTRTPRIRHPKIFQKILGKADRRPIFKFEEFSHDSDEIPDFPTNAAGPTPWMPPGLRFLRRFSPLFPPSGPATGFSNGLHPKSKFLGNHLTDVRADTAF